VIVCFYDWVSWQLLLCCFTYDGNRMAGMRFMLEDLDSISVAEASDSANDESGFGLVLTGQYGCLLYPLVPYLPFSSSPLLAGKRLT
jgi:hypothetical protein